MAEPDEPLDVPEPRRLSRRAFVKGCIAGSAVAVAGGSAYAMFNPLSNSSNAPFKRVEYLGATLVSGPAPQGVPLMPLTADASGDVSVDPAPPAYKDGVEDWFKYCAHDKTVGLQPGFKPQDEKIRYFLTEEKKATIVDGWYLPRLGQVVNLRHFDQMGKGAGFNWRSEGQTGKNIISGIVIKIDPSKLEFKNAPESVVRDQFIVTTPDGGALIAYSSFCKHFCCVPGWHESPLALSQGFFDKMFCTCHFSVYDPYLVKGDYYMLQLPQPVKPGVIHV